MTTKIKVIRTKEDYKAALKLIEELMVKNPAPNTDDSEKLNLLATLVHDYESKTFPESLPDPIDAIVFRMEQQNLKPTDLVKYIGSRSKVSEVLSRKRPLTLTMIRALEVGLGIPAKVLVQEPDEFRSADDIAWSRFPINEMSKRNYFSEKVNKGTNLKNLLTGFFQPIGSPDAVVGLLRKCNCRSSRPMDKHALVVWSAQVVKKAKALGTLGRFQPELIDLAYLQKLAKLSRTENSPLVVQKELESIGIAIVVEPHFSQTYLDGATILEAGNPPTIGLTLRHDRLDNFWFTLMHELAHIALHRDLNINLFYDDLDNPDLTNKWEREADRLAGEALVPEAKWENSPARLLPSPIAAESLARELGVHIAIVAGKMRHTGSQYTYLTNIVGQAKVRQLFPNQKWSK